MTASVIHLSTNWELISRRSLESRLADNALSPPATIDPEHAVVLKPNRSAPGLSATRRLSPNGLRGDVVAECPWGRSAQRSSRSRLQVSMPARLMLRICGGPKRRPPHAVVGQRLSAASSVGGAMHASPSRCFGVADGETCGAPPSDQMLTYSTKRVAEQSPCSGSRVRQRHLDHEVYGPECSYE